MRIIDISDVVNLRRYRPFSNLPCRTPIAPLLAALALGLGGCETRTLQEIGPGALEWQQTDLYFAIGRAGDSAAGEIIWRRFTESEVIPRFPDGFTIVPAIGTWRTGDSGSPPELDSRVLVILHPPSHDADERIEAHLLAQRIF
jgi:hypothetical protein